MSGERIQPPGLGKLKTNSRRAPIGHPAYAIPPHVRPSNPKQLLGTRLLANEWTKSSSQFVMLQKPQFLRAMHLS